MAEQIKLYRDNDCAYNAIPFSEIIILMKGAPTVKTKSNYFTYAPNKEPQSHFDKMQILSEREHFDQTGSLDSIRLFALYDVILLISLC